MTTQAESRNDRIRREEEEMLARFGGRRQLLVTVIGVFQESYPEMLASLRDAAAKRDATGLENTAHKLKGAICNLIKGPAYDRARDLEFMGREERWEEVHETLAALEIEMERLKDTLEAVKGA